MTAAQAVAVTVAAISVALVLAGLAAAYLTRSTGRHHPNPDTHRRLTGQRKREKGPRRDNGEAS